MRIELLSVSCSLHVLAYNSALLLAHGLVVSLISPLGGVGGAGRELDLVTNGRDWWLILWAPRAWCVHGFLVDFALPSNHHQDGT